MYHASGSGDELQRFSMSQAQPLGPFKLVTVNTAPERARRIIGRVAEAVKDKYTIIHAANVEGEQITFLAELFTS